MPIKQIKRGDIFIAHLDNGQEVPGREEVIIEKHDNGNYFTRGIFRDGDGNPSFRPLAGGTASPINIGEITGHMSRRTLEKLEADLDKETKIRKESE